MRLFRPARLASALVVLALAATACGTGTSTTARETSPRTSAPSGSTPDGSTSAPTDGRPSAAPSDANADTDTDAPERTTVAAYFVGDTPQGPRLFREFRSVPAAAPLAAAAALVTQGDIADPDYRTLFPRGSFRSITTGDGLLLVELSDDTWTRRPPGMSRRQASLAVQQLVHTLQAVQQARVPLTVLLDGEPTSLFGVDTRQGVSNDDPLDVLALVSVTSPEQGATVRGTLQARGVASSVEANVPWEIRRGSERVLTGFATAEGWLDKLHPWRTEIDVSGLEPGSYTFVARTDDQSDGEGAGPTEDTRDFTVD